MLYELTTTSRSDHNTSRSLVAQLPDPGHDHARLALMSRGVNGSDCSDMCLPCSPPGVEVYSTIIILLLNQSRES
jgi:hypothetical protein